MESKMADEKPDFLAVAPPRCGTTWLHRCLSLTPGFHMPEPKELKYFSNYLDVCDLSWYRSKFKRHDGVLSGDISPSYSILPIDTIREIKVNFQALKIIFVFRHPLERLLSHLKHQFRTKEGPFHSISFRLEECSDLFLTGYLTSPQTYLFCDYAGMVIRWRKVFGDDVYIDFLDLDEPKDRLLTRVVSHIGGTPSQWLAGVVDQKVNATEAHAFPPRFIAQARRFLFPHVAAFKDVLDAEFRCEFPTSWRDLLEFDTPNERAAYVHADYPLFTVDDRDLATVLLNETVASDHVQEFYEDYLGFRVVNFRGKFFALRGEALARELFSFTASELNMLICKRDAMIADPLKEILMLAKLQHELENKDSYISTMERALQEARSEVANRDEDIGLLRLRLDELAMRPLELEREFGTARDALAAKTHSLDQLRNDIEQREQRIGELERLLAERTTELERELGTVRDALAAKTQSLDQLRNELEQREQRIGEFERLLAERTTEMKRELGIARDALSAKTQSLDQLRNELEQREQRIGEFERLLAERTTDLNQVREELDHCYSMPLVDILKRKLFGDSRDK
jgi:archaellum component FlaC